MAIDTLAADRALEPSAGTLLRRRVFGHFGFMIGLAIIVVILAIALLATPLEPKLNLPTPARHRPARPRISEPPHLLLANLAADRLQRGPHLRPHRHQPRPHRRLFRR